MIFLRSFLSVSIADWLDYSPPCQPIGNEENEMTRGYLVRNANGLLVMMKGEGKCLEKIRWVSRGVILHFFLNFSNVNYATLIKFFLFLKFYLNIKFFMSVAIEKANFYTWYIYFVWTKVAFTTLYFMLGGQEWAPYLIFLLKGLCHQMNIFFEGL
jgi:hypothetical protein